jgi:hypothetical protein
MARWICTALGVLLLACSSAPDRRDEKILFQGGPEFRAAVELRRQALDYWDAAVMTQDPAKRERALVAADIACEQAQLQYEHAMVVYSPYQREEIEAEMAYIHFLRMEIERERHR